MYIDGGQLWWEPGMADGTYGSLIGDGIKRCLIARSILIL